MFFNKPFLLLNYEMKQKKDTECSNIVKESSMCPE